MSRLLLLTLLLFAGVSPLQAHYHMLLPNKSSVKKGEEVILTFQYGHPFEHQLFNASKPQRAFVVTPEGKHVNVISKLEETKDGQGDKKVTSFVLKYTPEERGDHLVMIQSAPHTIEGKKEAVVDTVKVIIHVEAQKNWHQTIKNEADRFELLPLTRPYGIRPGMVFRVALEHPSERLRDVLVEIERYNPLPPKELPPDEHITYTVLTDADGVAAATLPEPGWWCITAVGEKQRSTLWVYVDEKIPTRPNQ